MAQTRGGGRGGLIGRSRQVRADGAFQNEDIIGLKMAASHARASQTDFFLNGEDADYIHGEGIASKQFHECSTAQAVIERLAAHAACPRQGGVGSWLLFYAQQLKTRVEDHILAAFDFAFGLFFIFGPDVDNQIADFGNAQRFFAIVGEMGWADGDNAWQPRGANLNALSEQGARIHPAAGRDM